MNKLFVSTVLFLSIGQLRSQATWADNVACIVYSHCTGCHNPKGVAPFSLLNYDTAFIYASSIRHAVEDSHMPPWPVDNSFRKMAHDRSLSEGEKNETPRRSPPQ